MAGAFRLGINLPNFGRAGTVDRIGAAADLAIARGVDLVMLSDHVVVTPDVAVPYPEPFLEAFTTLAWLAGRRPGVRVGISVAVVPYRHPMLTSRLISTLGALSGTRPVLGVGSGWAHGEFEALGLDFTDRGPATDRSLATLATTAVDADIWVGGATAVAIRRTIAFGTAWHPINPTWESIDNATARFATSGRVIAIAPRLRIRVDHARTEAGREIGTGSREQILSDLRRLTSAGIEDLIIDPGDAASGGSATVSPGFDEWLTTALDLVDVARG